MEVLQAVLGRLMKKRVLVIGDLMLDTYTKGSIERISPEAPVGVLHVQSESHLPGGAGNVALNLCALGAEVFFAGRVGCDPAGEKLLTAFISKGINTQCLISQPAHITPIKNRLIASQQQVLRIDYENIEPLPEAWEALVLEHVLNVMKSVDMVAISDYGKGFLTDTLLAKVIGFARSLGVPVVVDPKGIKYGKYTGATLIKPNLKEAFAASHLPDTAPLSQVASEIFSVAPCDYVLITRAKDGMSLFSPSGEEKHFPAAEREVVDVTGAGDTALAMICFAFANRIEPDLALQLANVASSIAVSRLGCAQVSLADISKALT